MYLKHSWCSINTWVLLITTTAILNRVSSKYLDLTKMPRSDTIESTDSEIDPRSLRGFKIMPKYMFSSPLHRSELPVESKVTDSEAELVHKLVSEAAEFFKRAIKLKIPIKQSGMLLSRTCEFKPNTGTIYASNEPVKSACPERCGVVTFCGPNIKIPNQLLQICEEQSYRGQILSIDPYTPNPQVIREPSDADFLLFVDIDAKETLSNELISDSAFCQLDLRTYRPIAGYLTFNSQTLQQGAANYEYLLAQVKQSIVHTLGFSIQLLGLSPSLNKFTYEGYPEINEERLPWHRLDRTDNLFVPIEEVLVKDVETDVDNFAYILKTPKVLQVARGFFNCPTIQGVPLENKKNGPQDMRFWEKRILPEELMSVFSVRDKGKTPVLSNFTLAYLEDTGWYIANYEVAQPIHFGANAGCAFLDKMSCQELIGAFPEFFCSPDEFNSLPSHQKCSKDLKSQFDCSLYEHDHKIPKEFELSQSNSNLAGSVYTDYCPLRGLERRDCTLQNSELGVSQFAFGNESKIGYKCMELSKDEENKLCAEQTSSRSNDYNLCRLVICEDRHYYIPSLKVNCTYNYEVAKINQKSTCANSFVCPPCQLMCKNCANFGRPLVEPELPEELPPVETPSSIPHTMSRAISNFPQQGVILLIIVCLSLLVEIRNNFVC